MKIRHPGFVSFAVIDPSKKINEEGQYKKFTVLEVDNFLDIIADAREKNFEIRYHYNDVKNNEGGTVPVKFIITEIPPGHIQPFHTHNNCYEITVVDCGEVYYVEDDVLDVTDTQGVKKVARLLRERDMVFDDEAKRHTVANFSDKYARLLTTQTPRPYSKDFVPDWSKE
jgi:hypothetical protein